MVGSVQVSGRVVETAIFKLNELGYDTTKIMSGTGCAPIAPVVKDDLKAMGSTNDSVIYYGSVFLTIRDLKRINSNRCPPALQRITANHSIRHSRMQDMISSRSMPMCSRLLRSL